MSFFSRLKDGFKSLFGMGGKSAAAPPPEAPPPEAPPTEPRTAPPRRFGDGPVPLNEIDFSGMFTGPAALPAGLWVHVGYDTPQGIHEDQTIKSEDVDSEVLANVIKIENPRKAWLWVTKEESTDSLGVGSTWINPDEQSVASIEDWIRATILEASRATGS